jgi:hypothetical protein
MRTNFSEDWKKNRDRIAGAESFDDDYGSAYDRIVYDVPNKGNAAGITLPKRPTQMTVGELEDNFRTAKNPTEARLRSQQYGAKRFGPNSPQARYGSSGTGKYQFEVTTLSQTAREVFGPNYRDVLYSPENQEKLGEYLYNRSAKAGTLGTTWAAMRDGSGTTQPQNKPMVASNQAAKPAEPAEKSEYEQGMNFVSGLWNKAIEAGKYAQKNPGKIPPALKSQFSEETSKVRFKDLRNKIHEENVTRMNWLNSAKSKLRSLAARDDEVVAATDDGADEYTKGVKSRGWYYPTAKAAAAAVTFSAAPGTYCQRKPQSCIDGKPAKTVDADGKPLIDAFGKRTTAGMENGVLHASQWQHMLSDPEEYKKIKALADADPTKGQPGNEEGIARNPDGTEYGNVSDYHKFLLRKGYNVTLQDVWDEDGGYRRNADGSITEESNPIRFKHLRNKIYEQIILNESLEKEDK